METFIPLPSPQKNQWFFNAPEQLLPEPCDVPEFIKNDFSHHYDIALDWFFKKLKPKSITGLKVKHGYDEDIVLTIVTVCLEERMIDKSSIEGLAYMIASWFDLFSKNQYIAAQALYKDAVRKCEDFPEFVVTAEDANSGHLNFLPMEYQCQYMYFYFSYSQHFIKEEIIEILQDAWRDKQKFVYKP